MQIAWQELDPATAADPGWSHSGIAVTDSGAVIFADPSGGRLILCRPFDDGWSNARIQHIAVPLLEIHSIFAAGSGDLATVWLADPGFKAKRELGYETTSAPGQAGSLDLSTKVFSPLPAPPLSDKGIRWEPTSVVSRRSVDGSTLVIVADGYGASLVHFYSDGSLIQTIDGSTSGVAFSCPHGLVIDERSGHPLLAVADRGNRRLVFFELDGRFVRSVTDPLLTSPSSLATRRDELLVTELDGALLAVSPGDSVHALIDTRGQRDRPGWPNVVVNGVIERPSLTLGELNSPHGIAVSADGRIYLTEWLIGGRQLELTLEESVAV